MPLEPLGSEQAGQLAQEPAHHRTALVAPPAETGRGAEQPGRLPGVPLAQLRGRVQLGGRRQDAQVAERRSRPQHVPHRVPRTLDVAFRELQRTETPQDLDPQELLVEHGVAEFRQGPAEELPRGVRPAPGDGQLAETGGRQDLVLGHRVAHDVQRLTETGLGGAEVARTDLLHAQPEEYLDQVLRRADLPHRVLRLPQAGERGIVVTAERAELRQHHGELAGGPPVPEFPEQLQCCAQVFLRDGRVPGGLGGEAQSGDAGRARPGILVPDGPFGRLAEFAEPARHLPALGLDQGHQRIELHRPAVPGPFGGCAQSGLPVLVDGGGQDQPYGREQRRRRFRDPVAEAQQFLQPSARLGVPAAHHPVPAQGQSQPDGRVHVVTLDGPPQGGQRVVVLGVQPGDALRLLRSAQAGGRGLHEVEEVPGAGGLGPFRLARLDEPLPAVGACRLRHPVADGAAGVLPYLHEGLVGQGRQQVEDLVLGHLGVGADRHRGLRRHGARHRRHPSREDPFGVAEQVPAPVHHGPQGAVACAGRAAAVAEQAEAVVQAAGDLLDGHRAEPGGGQLDGQGETVQLAADLHDMGDVVRMEGEPGADQTGPVAEELDGGGVRRLLR